MKVILKNNLRQARKRKNITQTELAIKTGLTQNTISSIEFGNCNPSCLTALLISRVLNMNIEDIFYTTIEKGENCNG